MHRIHVLAVALALVTGACASASSDTTTPTTAAPPTTTTTAAPPTTVAPDPTTTTTEAPNPPSPLNGLPADDPALLARRVIAVKIDNHWDARPQSGIELADAVYELPVEANLTRFIALFHDADAEYLGPMRSGRPTDPTLLKPFGATFTISGAQDWVIGVINRSGVPVIGEIRPATFRVGSRYAPHNLYVDTTLLRTAADDRGYGDDPPADMFEWGDLPAGDYDFADEILFDWSPDTKVTWHWADGRYERHTGGAPQEWIAEDGEERGPITADTLVVLYARRYTASGGSGSAVPAMETVGSGDALVFADGKVVAGTWERASIDDVFSLDTLDGRTLTVPAGVPWVSIFPNTRQVTW